MTTVLFAVLFIGVAMAQTAEVPPCDFSVTEGPPAEQISCTPNSLTLTVSGGESLDIAILSPGPLCMGSAFVMPLTGPGCEVITVTAVCPTEGLEYFQLTGTLSVSPGAYPLSCVFDLDYTGPARSIHARANPYTILFSLLSTTVLSTE